MIEYRYWCDVGRHGFNSEPCGSLSNGEDVCTAHCRNTHCRQVRLDAAKFKRDIAAAQALLATPQARAVIAAALPMQPRLEAQP